MRSRVWAMPITAEHVGRTYPPTDAYVVSAAKIAEFATALGDGNAAYQGREPIAPPTFAAVIAAQAWGQLFDDPDLDLALRRVVHGDQSFVWHRPMRTGDEVVGVLTIDKVRARGAIEFVGVTVKLTTTAGQPICDATSTLVHTRSQA